MTAARVFDGTACLLGEGPLWHPERQELLWFDILGKRLFARGENDGAARHWRFDEHVSAAGLIDRDTLLVASETALFRFDLVSGRRQQVVALEADRPGTRSNDGRADPWGGFWIGTMGKSAEKDAGAIYRYFKGGLRRLFSPITIPNAICFAPDRRHAYFTDTVTRRVMRQPLEESEGWPLGAPEVFLDLRAERLNPDGAVVDSEGVFWNAQWGASRVAAYDPAGRFLRAMAFPARQTSCPAFGGRGFMTLFCTSASDGLDPAVIAAEPGNGTTLAAAPVDAAPGQPEHRVVL